MSPQRSLLERLREDGEVRLNSPIEVMRFTLIYDGRLPAQGSKSDTRLTEKHAIRRELHGQLRELWASKPILADYLERWQSCSPGWSREQFESRQHTVDPGRVYGYQSTVQSFQRGTFTFLPLITARHHLLCELDVLFLRAEKPGKLFTTNAAGDLDNRIKVLFDALRIPCADDDLPKDAVPTEGEEPLFCLLENDNLITAVRVESERLLDVEPGSGRVRLVIRVTVKADALTVSNMGVVGGG